MDRIDVDKKLKKIILEITKGSINNPHEDFNLTSFQMLRLVSQIEEFYNIEIEDKLIYRRLSKSYNMMLDYVLEKIQDKYQVKKIADYLTEAFLNGAKERFLSYFDIDILSKYYLSKAFDNYTLFPILRCVCTILNDNCKQVDFLFIFDYINGSHEEVIFKCGTQLEIKDNPINHLKIINTFCMIETDDADFPISNLKNEIVKLHKKSNVDWFAGYEALVHKQLNTIENVNTKYYLRLLSKSIRYRMSDSDIESAIILSNIVSKNLTWFSLNTIGDTWLKTLKNINYGFKKIFKHKTYDEFKDENKDYFPVKELSFENVPANFDVSTHEYMEIDDTVEVRCSEIAHIYSALFALNGMCKNQFVLILPFHYMNYIEINNTYFLIDVNHIVEMQKNRVYGTYDEITGCATATHYLNQGGSSNMPNEMLNDIVNIITEKLENFKFKYDCKCENILSGCYDFKVDFQKSYEENAHDNLLKLYDGSKDNPVSPFTSAKYVGQFIVVEHPQIYIEHGIKNEEVIKFSKEMLSEESLISWISSEIKEGTLFSHSIQIMTPNQVIKYHIGRVYDKALLIYTVKKINGWINNGIVVFTDHNAYILEDYGKCFDVSKMEYVDELEGNIIISFNESVHYSLWHQKEKLKRIIKETYNGEQL